MRSIAILGAGPAGLLAAHAVRATGNVPAIFSNPTKSTIFGAQYLHVPIPGITSHAPSGKIHYLYLGSGAIYERKVYGDNSPGTTSFGRFSAMEPYYDLKAAYDMLWGKYERDIIYGQVPVDCFSKFDMVASTIPMTALCHGDHEFTSVDICVRPGWPLAWRPDCPTIVYSGREEDEWARASYINGKSWTEYGGDTTSAALATDDPVSFVASKPLATDCDCWPNFLKVGRRGAWDRHALVHDAYFKVKAEIEARGWNR